jgi:hypothetical protein
MYSWFDGKASIMEYCTVITTHQHTSRNTTFSNGSRRHAEDDEKSISAEYCQRVLTRNAILYHSSHPRKNTKIISD